VSFVTIYGKRCDTENDVGLFFLDRNFVSAVFYFLYPET